MNSIPDLAGQPLKWRQPSLFKERHELVTEDGSIVARMEGTGTFLKEKYLAEGFGGSWEFIFPDFWSQSVGIRETGKNLPFATLVGRLFSMEMTLELPKGERWTVRHRMWKGIHEVKDGRGLVVLTSRTKLSFTWMSEMTISPPTATLEWCPWVLMLVYMLQVRQRRRASHG